MFLTPSQLTSLTGKQRYSAQARELWKDELAWIEMSVAQRYRWMDDHYEQFIEPLADIAARKCRVGASSLLPGDAGVYFLFFEDALQYVGRAVHVSSRIAQHRYPDRPALVAATWFDGAAWVLAPVDFINQLEGHYIRTFKPPRNIRPGARCRWGS